MIDSSEGIDKSILAIVFV